MTLNLCCNYIIKILERFQDQSFLKFKVGMTKVHFSQCSKCSEELSKYGSLPEEIYFECCDYFSNGDFLEIECGSISITVVEFLEKRKFVISCESGETTVRIKPVNFQKTDQGFYFCARPDKHKKNGYGVDF
jgi:hypothetical protein